MNPYDELLPYWRAWAEAHRARDEASRIWAEAHHALDKAHRAYAEAYRALDEAHRAYAEAHRAWDDASRAWDEACRRICGQGVSMERDDEGCTVAGVMRFEYESIR